MLFRTAGLIAAQRDSDVPLTSTGAKAASSEGGGKEGWMEGRGRTWGQEARSDGGERRMTSMKEGGAQGHAEVGGGGERGKNGMGGQTR